MKRRGLTSKIQIVDHRKLKTVRARVDLFGTGLGVLNDGPHQLVVPYWDNRLVHDLLRHGVNPQYGPDTLVHQVVKSVFAASQTDSSYPG